MTTSPLAALGAVFTAVFLGGLASQLAVGPLNDRFGERPTLLAGLALCALGVAGMAASHALSLTLASALLVGLGGGALIISASVLVAEVFVSRSVSALNTLNVFYAVGAIAGPLLASLLLKTISTALPALWAATVTFLVLLPFAVLLPIPPRTRQGEDDQARTGKSIYSAALLWALGALLLVYVGTETGVNGWTATYMDRTTTMGPETAALVVSGFWLALTMGRIIGAVLGVRLRPIALLLASASGALVGGLLLAVSTGNAGLSVIGTLMLGLCFGPVFPTAIAITTASFRNAPGKAASAVAAMGSAGGMMLPALQGVLIEGIGPNAGAWQVAASTGVLLGLALLVRAVLARGKRGVAAGKGQAAREEASELDVA